MSFVQFAVSVAVAVIAGTYLSKYGNAIDAANRLSSLWIGVVLLAAATSLPEVLANTSAVIVGAPDLAVGDIFGAATVKRSLIGQNPLEKFVQGQGGGWLRWHMVRHY